MDLNEHGLRALARFRASRARREREPFLDRRTVTLAIVISVVLVGTLWMVQRQLAAPPPVVQEDLSGFSVFLHHQGCAGTCPTYAVLVRGDGTVEYEGVDFVAIAGPRRATLDQLAVRALNAAVRRSGIESAPPAIKPGAAGCAHWSVGPELLRIGVTRAGRTSTVDYYPGCQPGDPKLATLVREVDALAGTARWVSPSAQR